MYETYARIYDNTILIIFFKKSFIKVKVEWKNSRRTRGVLGLTPWVCLKAYKVYPADPAIPNRIPAGAPAVAGSYWRHWLKNDILSDTHCPILGSPVSGRKYGSSYNKGDIVKFKCNRGFVLKGSAVRVCRENRTWNGTEIFCKGIEYCPLFPWVSVLEKVLFYWHR